MARTEGQLSAVGQHVDAASGAIVEVQRINVPYTTIVNRAQMVDPSKDLLPRFGIDRIQVQHVVRADSESGPNGEAVWKPINDKFDQIRFVGNGWNNINGNNGPYVDTGTWTSPTSFIEVVFFGTGLNVLCSTRGANLVQSTINVDGVDTSTVVLNASTSSAILDGRNYSQNKIVNVASNLSLGLHTVRIPGNASNATVIQFYGFEILNTSSTVQLPAGSIWSKGRKLTQASLATTAYNSGFEVGSLGSRGGRVVVYKKSDGTTAKAVTPTDGAAAYLTSANHQNEELIRSYFWREFGAGRSDDFSTLTGTSASRGFTLDDGTTTLIGSQVQGASEALVIDVNANSVVFQFVGTGLDIVWYADGGGTNGATNYEWFVNGSSIGYHPTVAVTGTSPVIKIASGLPYGTHTVRLTRNAVAVWKVGIKSFNVYGPKKPTLPAGAVEVADYNIMADYVANSTAGLDTIATGILRKNPSREAVYISTGGGGGEALNLSLDPASAVSGFNARGNQNWEYEYVFFGTGFDLRGNPNTNRSDDIDVYINGVLFNTAFPSQSAAATTYGAMTYTPAGSNLSMNGTNTTGGGFRVTGLPLGIYRLRLDNNAVDGNDYMFVNALDVITPIHVHKNNGPFILQNTLAVGSQGIGDLRKFGDQLNESLQNVRCNRFVGGSTASGSMIPIGYQCGTIYSTGKPLLISANASIETNSNTARHVLAVVANGIEINRTIDAGVYNGTNARAIDTHLSTTITLPRGWHHIHVTVAQVEGQTITVQDYGNPLIITEVPQA